MIVGYCAKHNQYAKYANARGFGACPPGKFWKIEALRLNLGMF